MATGSIVMKMGIFLENQGSLWKISFSVLTVSVQIIIEHLAIAVIITLLN